MRMGALVMTGVLAAATAAPSAGESSAELKEEVRRAEIAFAKTMADRDHAAFGSFLAEETIFAGPDGPLRGKQRVMEGWRRFFQGPRAPFSWEPELVEVVGSGTLAMSSGPVRDPAGKPAGTFHSVWRREADGRWRILFDNGCAPCNCGGAPSTAPSPSPSPKRTTPGS